MNYNSKMPSPAAVVKFSAELVCKTNLKKAVCENCSVRDRAICASLDDKMFASLNHIRTDKTIKANQVLFEEGDNRKFVYTLREGMLRLVTSLSDGRRQILGFLAPGDFIGLIDERCYTQTAEAVVESRLCCFRKDALDEVMEKSPEMRHTLLCMTRRSLKEARENQFLLGRMTPLEKMASFLVICSRRAREAGLPDNPVHLAMNRTDIADYLGLTVETVSRSFSKLKAQGLIRLVETNLVYIAKMDALCFVTGSHDNYH